MCHNTRIEKEELLLTTGMSLTILMLSKETRLKKKKKNGYYMTQFRSSRTDNTK